MKKVLLFASAIALMTSCAKTELSTETAPVPVKGISFKSVAITENTDTKAEWEQDPISKEWNMLWYAESDGLAVFYKGEAKRVADLAVGADWSATNVANYKATRTAAKGAFAAIEDAEAIEFTGAKDKKASFRLVWPDTSMTGAATEQDEEGNAQIVVNLPAIGTQDYTKPGDEVKYVFMVNDEATKSLTDVVPAKVGAGESPAVADVLEMSMMRPFPVVYFKLKNYDVEKHGLLQSISLEAKGYTKPGNTTGTPDVEASRIDYGANATYNVETGEITETTTTNETKVTLNFNSGTGMEWEDGKPAFMAINTVDHEDFKGEAEEFEVVYTFENAVVTKTLSRAKVLAPGTFYNMSGEGLDLDAEPYLVNKGSKKLLLNSVDLTKVGKDVTSANVEELISMVDLSSAANVAALAKYTSLKNVGLLANTAIPSKMFAKQTGLLAIAAPIVETIAEDAFGTNTPAFTDVILPSFDFSTDENEAISKVLLPIASLESVDITSASGIGTDFPSTGISFTNYNKLEEVTLGNGAVIRDYAFKNCIGLVTINNFKNVGEVGKEAFAGCQFLEEAYAGGTTIGEGAFYECVSLKTITAPTVKIIGKNAFYKAGSGAADAMKFVGSAVETIGEGAFDQSDITTMDFSNVTTIEKTAFNKCDQLIGKKLTATKNLIAFPALTELKESVFSYCTAANLYFSFPKVTKLTGKTIFGDAQNTAGNIKEIEFLSAFVITKDVQAIVSETVANTRLYVPAAMQDKTQKTFVEDKALNWEGTNMSATFVEIAVR